MMRYITSYCVQVLGILVQSVISDKEDNKGLPGNYESTMSVKDIDINSNSQYRCIAKCLRGTSLSHM